MCSLSGVVIVAPPHGATRYRSTGHSLNQRCGKLLLGLPSFPVKPKWEPPQFVHFVCPQNHVDTEVCSLQKLIWACLREQLARKLSSGGSPRQCVCGKNPSVLEPKMGFQACWPMRRGEALKSFETSLRPFLFSHPLAHAPFLPVPISILKSLLNMLLPFFLDQSVNLLNLFTLLSFHWKSKNSQ